MIVPVTAYTSEWFEREIIGGERLVAADPRLAALSRDVETDSQGRFRVTGLAPGEYFITSRFTYTVENVYDVQGAEDTIQAVAKARVSLSSADRVVNIAVSR